MEQNKLANEKSINGHVPWNKTNVDKYVLVQEKGAYVLQKINNQSTGVEKFAKQCPANLSAPSFKGLHFSQIYEKLCGVDCQPSSVQLTSHNYHNSQYYFNNDFNEGTTVEEIIYLCEKKYQSKLLSLESDTELDFIMNSLKNMKIFEKNGSKILLGLQKKDQQSLVWQSGNPFLSECPSTSYENSDVCFYLDLGTNSSKTNLHFKDLIKSYNCQETVQEVYVVCECTQILHQIGYDRLVLASNSSKHSLINADVSVYNISFLSFNSRYYRKHFVLNRNNCTNKTNSYLDQVEEYFCGKLDYNNGRILEVRQKQFTYPTMPNLSQGVPIIVCHYENHVSDDSFPHKYSEFNDNTQCPRSSCPVNSFNCLGSGCVDFDRLNDDSPDCPYGDDETVFK
ncbi:hypothetical protein Btru_077144 [Bulinus truncatus]|nr:hypothetical protein Btru_077144 [Bulinus truncatus]